MNSRACISVHPRVCGERDQGQAERVADRGSSPRVRGTRNQVYKYAVR